MMFAIPRSVLTVFSKALPIMVISFAVWDRNRDFLQSQNVNNYLTHHIEEFDFIIVGAGSAGSVLANRLSSNPDYRVLLLESGGNPNPLQNVPVYFQSLLHIPELDHGHYTVPQKNVCLAMRDHRSYWPRGLGLGGSSNLNVMNGRFDSIFKKISKTLRTTMGSITMDGQGIFVNTSAQENLVDEFLKAGIEMGYPTKDVNGNQEPSFSRLDFSIKNGRRFGAYQGFLAPVLNRTNLHIYRFAHVNKIHLRKETNRAYAVTYKRHGLERFVRAKREIIISAGAIDSPKLLMLSGIGPKQHLESLGIECRIDLPVGKNLMDHISVPVGPFIEGQLASPIGANAVAYIYSSLSKARADFWIKSPDIQLLLLPANPNLHQTVEEVVGIKPGFIEKYLRGLNAKDIFMINVMLGKPSSRGEIKLTSKHPWENPIMDPKYFSHSDDIKRVVDGMNFTVHMAENTEAFRNIGTRLINKHFPGCEKYELKTNSYYECYARHMTYTGYDQSGTCAMGYGPEDRNAGSSHKRGCVSWMPHISEIPNGNINTAVIMAADKASELILDYWTHVDNSMRSRPFHF
ncbi:Glucose dehydrogenase [FAD, quinone] [Orchesella cincta]|uniref:Glucose dehydrogenase [FAD, quinone] n=1 Tax=Orchesella cincta TaxID=48709 RepID=A0A1D2M2R5_ORCCI|nr:Glucose dehydrogenase [FAD, quinone] [Orchesella cincta]